MLGILLTISGDVMDFPDHLRWCKGFLLSISIDERDFCFSSPLKYGTFGFHLQYVRDLCWPSLVIQGFFSFRLWHVRDLWFPSPAYKGSLLTISVYIRDFCWPSLMMLGILQIISADVWDVLIISNYMWSFFFFADHLLWSKRICSFSSKVCLLFLPRSTFRHSVLC